MSQNRISAVDGPLIKTYGQPKVKKPNPVYFVPVETKIEVETNEGTLTAQPGDSIAYDPISGHVWPVAASYVEQHYTDVDPDAVLTTVAVPLELLDRIIPLLGYVGQSSTTARSDAGHEAAVALIELRAAQ